MMRSIDLRSDTVTRPSADMRAAAVAAEVGDDVFEEDPTVARLEHEAAEILGKEAALFVPSGTMSNLLAVLVHCGRGDEIIVGDCAHIFTHEVAGIAALGGVQACAIPNHNGVLDPNDVESAIRSENIHFPVTRLLCIENTHNGGGGYPVSLQETRAMVAPARSRGVRVHLDGSRLFNAAVALQVDVRALAAESDTVNICFSKGLGAPIGSALVGTRECIKRARRLRKMLGGGMRQVGFIAAAALVALREGPKRLSADHQNAKIFAQCLAESGDFDVNPEQVRTNIVLFSPRRRDPALHERWRAAGVFVNARGNALFRAVTHLDVTREDVLEAGSRIVAAMRSTAA